MDDREADFARSDQRRMERILAHLDVPENVFQHDDRIVDDEADGEDERHHREVVEAVVEEVHHRERADDQNGSARLGMTVAHVPQEHEDHQDDEQQRRPS
jgi:hypothetical protein